LAFSVRRLYSQYTGACLRVRRDSDDAEQDIGFDSNGDLDTSALGTFVGSGNKGYVRYWYDQSQSGTTGAGNDAGNATKTNQPVIYDGSNPITSGTRPAIVKDVNTSVLSFTTDSLTTGAVFAAVETFGNGYVIDNNLGNNDFRLRFLTNRYYLYVGTITMSSLAGETTRRLLMSWYNDATNAYLRLDATLNRTSAFSDTASFELICGGNSNSASLDKTSEFIMYDSSKSASDVGDIEDHQNNYFSIY
jgi:hypothetical protein